MELIKKMKGREFLEMAIKTITALFACALAILLMEGMIYGIQMNALANKGTSATSKESITIAYCVEREEDKYTVIFYNEDDTIQWSCNSLQSFTKEECEQLKVAKIVYGQPSPFDLTITPVHYVVMAVFVAAVLGYFVYKFVRLSIEYKKVEQNFKETGTIAGLE